MHKLSTTATESASLSSLKPLAVDTRNTGTVRIILGTEEKGPETDSMTVAAVQALGSSFPKARATVLRSAGRRIIELTRRDKLPFTAQELAAVKKFVKPAFETYGSASLELIIDSQRSSVSRLHHLATLVVVELSNPLVLPPGQLKGFDGADELWLTSDAWGRVTRIEASLIRPSMDCVPDTLNKLAASCGIFIEEPPAVPPCIACEGGHTVPA